MGSESQTVNSQRAEFEGITPEMWEYQIGGYQVLEKYLKDRKGRRMEDPVRYIHITARQIISVHRLHSPKG